MFNALVNWIFFFLIITLSKNKTPIILKFLILESISFLIFITDEVLAINL